MSLSRYLKRPNIEHFPLLHYSIVSLLSLVSYFSHTLKYLGIYTSGHIFEEKERFQSVHIISRYV